MFFTSVSWLQRVLSGRAHCGNPNFHKTPRYTSTPTCCCLTAVCGRRLRINPNSEFRSLRFCSSVSFDFYSASVTAWMLCSLFNYIYLHIACVRKVVAWNLDYNIVAFIRLKTLEPLLLYMNCCLIDFQIWVTWTKCAVWFLHPFNDAPTFTTSFRRLNQQLTCSRCCVRRLVL